MRIKGKTASYLQKLIDEGQPIHFSLIDPDKVKDLEGLGRVASSLYRAGTSAFLIGGTLGVSKEKLDGIIHVLQDFRIPKIIFPSNINLISEKADAILFMSLLNSDDLYYVIGAQVSASIIVKTIGLEPIPTGYLIVGHGGTAAHIGRARVVPYDNPELAVAYALAAEYMGMEYLYLEAGSGAPETVRPEMVKFVSKYSNINLIVGGGIRTPERAVELVRAGAKAIVTGNVIESDIERAIKIIEAMQRVYKIE
ncbi:Geranylgeranylglyceryl phosphate synthase [Metallosphaera sp. J1]|uniref:geranylgeranylglyceryl/heptaprenylglyceryl phosphate synthase n=1 Tax=Metallosphaera TaxID=41980 RepID=UPI001EDE0118|nr:geranylgeranylglyceryl/heptaprenylglyceryl phosphate synthase [Metallosphaera javensis (ex Hofmann et al. 2022)]MCG3107874.1 Geranylgeranylglyceryl phosphate synthase [Metallosphaera javensis (ex Hofmann et al. 2022)]BCS91972.1 MAG: geranylgeranylglyceryl phosphate synthase [Metallosphaera javensis (ex Sakai et al. 2022)]